MSRHLETCWAGFGKKLLLSPAHLGRIHDSRVGYTPPNPAVTSEGNPAVTSEGNPAVTSEGNPAVTSEGNPAQSLLKAIQRSPLKAVLISFLHNDNLGRLDGWWSKISHCLQLKAG